MKETIDSKGWILSKKFEFVFYSNERKEIEKKLIFELKNRFIEGYKIKTGTNKKAIQNNIELAKMIVKPLKNINLLDAGNGNFKIIKYRKDSDSIFSNTYNIYVDDTSEFLEIIKTAIFELYTPNIRGEPFTL